MNGLLAFIGGGIFASIIWTLALIAGRSRYAPRHSSRTAKFGGNNRLSDTIVATEEEQLRRDKTDCMWQ